MKSDEETVSVHRNGRVAVAGFAPAKDGTISNKGAASLLETLDALIEDDSIGAIVLHGTADGNFIRHANVAQIVRAADALAEAAIDEAAFASAPFARLCKRLDESPKPVIAAINGLCMGGGLEIALACTMRIAAPDVTHIGLPEIRIGIPPGAGGPQRLARLIGAHRARLFALSGRLVDAAEAERIGIVDLIAPDAVATAVDQAAIFAARLPAVVETLLDQTRTDDGAGLDANLRGLVQNLRLAETRRALAGFLASGAGIETFS